MNNYTTNVFSMTVQAFRRTARLVSSCGGARSGKTFSILQLFDSMARNPIHAGHIFSVVSETMPHLKRGAIRDYKTILGDTWEPTRWNATDNIYTYPTGVIIEFFSADSPSKVHGPARDYLFINEAQNISLEIARQLFIRTRRKIVCDYNPTHSFWLNEIYEPGDDCQVIRSTYKDNDYLTAEQVAEIERGKNDPNWWRVYGLGQIGQLEGVIYDFAQIDAMPDPNGLMEVYGLDFGFTNDPTACERILIDKGRKAAYVDEMLYRKGMLNSDISAALKAASVANTAPIYADSAEPKSIAELCTYGLNVHPAYKATRITEQIAFLKGFTLYVTKRSVNVIKELRNYTWQKDKDGNSINQPIDFWNHAMDALRYGIFTPFSEFAGGVRYSTKHISRR